MKTHESGQWKLIWDKYYFPAQNPRELPHYTVHKNQRGIYTEMKFKAFLTDNGITLLERRFIPALEKINRICHLYLTPDHVFFLHNLINGDDLQSVAQFQIQSLFYDYRISSQNQDRIAFSLDLSLLLRALRSSASIVAEHFGGAANRLQIKLVKKLPPNSTQPMPFLTFESKGDKSAVIQDVPISKPLSRAQVVELQTALDMAKELPSSLVQVTKESAWNGSSILSNCTWASTCAWTKKI